MFKQISRKLRSRSGASMLLAMVFMLFCVFVGSTVLAASTANSYRVAHLSDQQEYLDQRSAALLLRSQLDNGTMTIRITDLNAEKIPGTVVDGIGFVASGNASDFDYAVKVTATLSDAEDMTAMQRLALESVARYYVEQTYQSGTKPDVTLEVVQNGTTSTLSGQWTTASTGNIAVSGSTGSDAFANFNANFKCNGNFDFLVGFQNKSQMTLEMDSICYRKPPVRVEYYEDIPLTEDEDDAYQILATNTITTVIFRDPVIEKGEVI